MGAADIQQGIIVISIQAAFAEPSQEIWIMQKNEVIQDSGLGRSSSPYNYLSVSDSNKCTQFLGGPYSRIAQAPWKYKWMLCVFMMGNTEGVCQNPMLLI